MTSLRDADFNNDGTILSGDYRVFTKPGAWLSTSACVCSFPATYGGGPTGLLTRLRVQDASAQHSMTMRPPLITVPSVV